LPVNRYPKVAFLTDKAGIGGGETSLLNLLQSMKENSHQPLLFCPEGEMSYRAAELGIPVHLTQFPNVHLRAGLIPTFSVPTVGYVYQVIKKHRVDIVHAESLVGLYYGGLAARLAGVPCVATYHGYWQIKSKLFRLFCKMFCQKIYPVSEIVAAELKSSANLTGPSVQIIPLSFNNAFTAKLPSQTEARKLLELPIERPILMQIARFQAIKGHMNLLDAVEVMLEQNRTINPLVVMVGDVMEPATPEILKYKAAVEERVQTGVLRNHVQFLGHRNDVPLLMRAADVIVSPSDTETFGMIIIEALAVGTSVVATCIGGPGEILTDKITGILVPTREPNALAAGITDLLLNKDWAMQLAKRAKQEVMSKYGPTARYERLLHEYDRLQVRNRPKELSPTGCC
jgi:glycosyltransferase involved in cell wall biosynthesis